MGVKEIKFTAHVEEKLKRLKNLGVTKEKILKVLSNPRKIVCGYRERKIAITMGTLVEDSILILMRTI